MEWDCYHGCIIREDVSEYFSALQKEQPVFYDLMEKLDIDCLEQAWNKYQLPVDKEMQSRILTTAYVGIFLLRDVLSVDELERWNCFVYEKRKFVFRISYFVRISRFVGKYIFAGRPSIYTKTGPRYCCDGLLFLEEE